MAMRIETEGVLVMDDPRKAEEDVIIVRNYDDDEGDPPPAPPPEEEEEEEEEKEVEKEEAKQQSPSTRWSFCFCPYRHFNKHNNRSYPKKMTMKNKNMTVATTGPQEEQEEEEDLDASPAELGRATGNTKAHGFGCLGRRRRPQRPALQEASSSSLSSSSSSFGLWRIPSSWIFLLGLAASTSFVVLLLRCTTRQHHDQRLAALEQRASVFPILVRDLLQSYQVAALWAHQAMMTTAAADQYGWLDVNDSHDNATDSTSQLLLLLQHQNQRKQFTNVYHHIRSTGLPFRSMEYIPQVFHDQRAWNEQETRQFLESQHPQYLCKRNTTTTTTGEDQTTTATTTTTSNDDDSHNGYCYSGFTGLESTTNNSSSSNSSHGTDPRSDQEFYFVQHYVEPFRVESLDFDAYSSVARRVVMDQAMATHQATLSPRFGHQYPDDYAVVLLHPGMRATPPQSQEPSVLSTMPRQDEREHQQQTPPVPPPSTTNAFLTKIHFTLYDILRRVAFLSSQRTSVLGHPHGETPSCQLYLFDTTPALNDVTKEFLGGVSVGNCYQSPEEAMEPRNVSLSSPSSLSSCALPPVGLRDLLWTLNKTTPRHYLYQETISLLSREWTIVVIQETSRSSREEENEHWCILFGGAVMLAACAWLALWVHTDTVKTAKIYRLKLKAEGERAQLLVASANQTVRAERELNDYVAHEVRNPLAAAISAHSFVQSQLGIVLPSSSLSVDDTDDAVTAAMSSCPLFSPCPATRQAALASMQEDLTIVGNSLHFINDLLRSMLDTSRASTNCMVIEPKPTDILSDVLEPVRSMLYLRDHYCRAPQVRVLVECHPPELVVVADGLRLKQVVLNLARNSSKFVQTGFIRLQAQQVPPHQTIQISIEDSGPGVPLEKRDHLYSKFQSSLDTLHQGTGIGLSLCKTLADLMEMNLWLDDTYDSGVEGYPGARFVIDTNLKPQVEQDDNNGDNDDHHSNDSKDPSWRKTTHGNEPNSIPADAATHDNANGTDHKNQPKDAESLRSPLLIQQQEQQQQQLPKDLKVLFVDDDLILRKLFARTIRKVAPDWIIHEASNGETAIKLVEEHHPPHTHSPQDQATAATTTTARRPFDVIFIDQYMASSVEPQLLGTETVRALRARGVQSVICGLSASYNMKSAFVEAAGADGFWLKPFPTEPNQLRHELMQLLQSAAEQR